MGTRFACGRCARLMARLRVVCARGRRCQERPSNGMHRLGLAVPSTLRGGEHTCVAANEQIVHWSKCRIDSWQWGRSRRTRRRWQRRSAVWPAQWHTSWHISWHTSWHTSRMMWMMWMMWMHCSFRNGARLTLQSGPGTRPLMSKRKKVSTQRCQQINALVLRTCAPQQSLCCRRPPHV